jgi:hypothetical protein
MLTRMLALLCALLVAAPAYAKRDAKKPPKDKASGANVGLGVNAGYVYYGAGFGAEAWYALSKDMELTAKFLMTPETEVSAAGGQALYGEYGKFSQMSFAGLLRYFVYNSFYLTGGLSYATITGIYGYKENSTGTLYSTTIAGSAIMGHVGLGNQWKFSSFYVGADWVLAAFPLSFDIATGSETIVDAEGNAPTIDPIAFSGKTVKDSATKGIEGQMEAMALLVHVGLLL